MEKATMEIDSDVCLSISLLKEHGFTARWKNYSINDKQYWGLALYTTDDDGNERQVLGTVTETRCAAIHNLMLELGLVKELEKFKKTCAQRADMENNSEIFDQCLVFINSSPPETNE